MKKYIILSLILIILIFNLDIVMISVKDSAILFFNKVFISLFPFMILSDILFYYDYHIFLKNTFIGKFFSKIFNINSNSTIVFILSMLTGLPNNAVYINNLLDNGEINIEDANNLLTFSYFPSISFVIGNIGILIFNNIKIGLILYFSCLFNNLLIGLYFRKKNRNNIVTNKSNNNKMDFFDMLKKSIVKAINNLYLILSIIIIFTIIINLISKYLTINKLCISILSGILEITSGINTIGMLNIDFKYKLSLIVFILNFSSISIIIQSKSILSKYKINIKKILIIKLIFSLIISFTLFLMYPS